MKQTIWIILLVFLTTYTISAQRGNHQFDYEQFKSQKIAFITEKLNLTPAEAQQFWPVYNQFEKEKMEVQQKRRNLDEKTRDEKLRMSDQEVIKTTRSIAATFKKEAELQETYNEKFLKLLPPQKVLLLYRAEIQFRAHMFEQYRKRRSE
jgi:hypothetical protein